MTKVLLIFIDGLGIGCRAGNPLAAFDPRVLRLYKDKVGPFPRQGRCVLTDACLGVAGLPQSATGQTALLTGANAAEHLGRHLHGFPNQALRELIHQSSLFRRLREKGLRVTFANSYAPGFHQRRRRWNSVTTVMCQTAQIEAWGLDDLVEGRSLFMDFTNQLLIRRGFDVPSRTAREAAGILLRLAGQHDFCLYEYFLTDWVGHRGTFEEAVSILKAVDDFLLEVVSQAALSEMSVVVTSDHGNIECMERKQHTMNPVPTLLWGPIQGCAENAERLSLTDVTPLIEGVLTRRV